MKLQEVTKVKQYKFARRERISDRIATTLEEEFKKRILVGASGTGIFQQIMRGSEDRHSSAEGSIDLLFIGKPLINITVEVKAWALN